MCPYCKALTNVALSKLGHSVSSCVVIPCPTLDPALSQCNQHGRGAESERQLSWGSDRAEGAQP